MTLDNAAVDVFTPKSLIATVYRDARFLEGKSFVKNITTYPNEHITGISIFIDYDRNITGGQLSTYTPDEGIKCHFLDNQLHII